MWRDPFSARVNLDMETAQWPLPIDLSTRLSALLPTLNALAEDYGEALVQSVAATFERQIPSLY